MALNLKEDPWARMSQKMVDDGVGPLPHDPSLGLICNIIRAEPGIVQRIHDEGFDARVAGVELDKNPYHQDGLYSWWREGWFSADDNESKL